MIFNSVVAERPCLAGILLLACCGLLAGVGTRIGYLGGKWNLDEAAAPYARELPKSRLPRLPRGIFLALLFAAFPFLKGWCPGFLNQHGLFTLGLVCCEVSTTAWLLVAFLFQQTADNQRKARIDQFVSDLDSSVPAPVVGLETRPFWLRIWNWTNLALLLLLMAVIFNSLVTLPPA